MQRTGTLRCLNQRFSVPRYSLTLGTTTVRMRSLHYLVLKVSDTLLTGLACWTNLGVCKSHRYHAPRALLSLNQTRLRRCQWHLIASSWLSTLHSSIIYKTECLHFDGLLLLHLQEWLWLAIALINQNWSALIGHGDLLVWLSFIHRSEACQLGVVASSFRYHSRLVGMQKPAAEAFTCIRLAYWVDRRVLYFRYILLTLQRWVQPPRWIVKRAISIGRCIDLGSRLVPWIWPCILFGQSVVAHI